MKAILGAAILFPITFLIFSYLFEVSTSSKNGESYLESSMEYDFKCQYNAIEEFPFSQVCLYQTNPIN